MKTTSTPSKKKNTTTPEGKRKRKKKIDGKISTVSVIFGVIVVIGATAPFWHMWAESGTGKFMGFRSVRSFLSAFGHKLALLCCASFIFWTKNFIDPQHKKVIKIVNIIGGIFIAISAYFLLWIFTPYDDFSAYVYDIAFAISGIIVAYGMYLLNKFVVRTAFENKYNVRNLTAFIFRIRNKHFFPMAVEAINKENREKIEEDINKFDEEVFETLDEISK